MAEFSANFNQTNKVAGKPSILDLLAEESLLSALHPAFEFSVKVAASRYPESFLSSIWKYSDEIFYSILSLVEKHYLWIHSASFSETFYGLKRINNSKWKKANSLTFKQKVGSLMMLSMFPYLHLKLRRFYASIKEEIIQNSENDCSSFRNLFLKFYPYYHMIMEGTKMALFLLYTVKLIDIHSPSHFILQIAMAYLNPNEMTELSNKESVLFSSDSSLLINVLRKCSLVLKNASSFAMEYAFPAIVFSLKFAEWWHSSESLPQDLMNSSLPVPPPPVSMVDERKHLAHPSECAICHKIHKNPTVLSRSGYVFCYTCIYKFVDANKCCPVTNLQSEVDDLVRLYY